MVRYATTRLTFYTRRRWIVEKTDVVGQKGNDWCLESAIRWPNGVNTTAEREGGEKKSDKRESDVRVRRVSLASRVRQQSVRPMRETVAIAVRVTRKLVSSWANPCLADPGACRLSARRGIRTRTTRGQLHAPTRGPRQRFRRYHFAGYQLRRRDGLSDARNLVNRGACGSRHHHGNDTSRRARIIVVKTRGGCRRRICKRGRDVADSVTTDDPGPRRFGSPLPINFEPIQPYST